MDADTRRSRERARAPVGPAVAGGAAGGRRPTPPDRRRPPGGAERAAEPAPFVARETELALVRRLIAGVRGGHAAAVLFVGEAGAGKTRLLEEAGRIGAEAGFAVASARCLPFVTPLPYEPVVELVRKLGAAAGTRGDRRPPRIPPEILFARLVDALERAAGAAPVLFCLDDLHESDAATLDLVHYCIVRLADLPIAWVLSTRPAGPLRPFLHHLGRARLLERVELAPLEPGAIGELAAAALREGLPGDELVSMLARRSGGNPFLCLELLHALAALGDEALSEDGVSTLVPSGVAESVSVRRGQLSAFANRLVDWLAVLPEPASTGELASAEGRASDEVRRELELLVEQRLAAAVGSDSWSLAHSLVRDAVHASIREAELARLHQVAAGVLADASAARRAPLLAAAGRNDEAAACYLELAEESLLRSGGADAVALYARAIELARAAGDDALRRRAAMGEVLAQLRAGVVADAKAAAAILADELRTAGADEDLLLFLSRYGLALHDDASDLDSALRALAEAEPLVASARGAVRAEAAYAQAFLLAMAGEPARAMPFADRAVEAARECGDAALEARALTRLGFVTGMARDSEAATEILLGAASLARDAHLPAETARAYLNLSFFADAAGDAEQCAAYAHEGLAVVDLPPGVEVLLRANLSNALADGGDLDGALAYQLAARAAATRLAPRLEERVLVGLAHVHIQRGELDAARAALAFVDPPPGSFEYVRALEQRALLLEEEGRLLDALDRYAEAAAAADHPSALWCRVGAVRTACGLGRPDVARDLAAPLDALRGRWRGTDWLQAEARGFVEAANGRARNAEQLFEQAADACPSRFHSLRLRLEAARFGGDRDTLLDAIDALDALGARALADRGRAHARALGFRPGRRRKAAGVLSERERQVSLLVAAGKTNAEIGAQLYLSPRTVERHVGAILQKLGYRSRVELAARVAAGALPGAPAS